jgi:hypothetical protein
MPAALGALFLIAMGSGVLAVAYRGWRDGELPAGNSLWRQKDSCKMSVKCRVASPEVVASGRTRVTY